MKLIYAVQGDAAGRLADPELRRRLAGAGAIRLQLNLDDDAVAPAMRITTGPQSVSAVASVWTEHEAEPITEVLTDHLGSDAALSGWEVEERRPIPPPEVGDGQRSDALANVALLRRPRELEPEEWRHRWQVDHTPVAIATQASFGYVQNRVLRPVTAEQDGLADIAAVVEELFPIAGMTDVHAFYGSGGDDTELTDRLERLMASCARFGADRDLELVPSSRYVFELAATR